MKVIAVAPKDIYVNLEISLSELEMVRTALGNATINMDSSNPKEVEAANFLTKGFYPTIDNLIKDLKGEKDEDES